MALVYGTRLMSQSRISCGSLRSVWAHGGAANRVRPHVMRSSRPIPPPQVRSMRRASGQMNEQPLALRFAHGEERSTERVGMAGHVLDLAG